MLLNKKKIFIVVICLVIVLVTVFLVSVVICLAKKQRSLVIENGKMLLAINALDKEGKICQSSLDYERYDGKWHNLDELETIAVVDDKYWVAASLISGVPGTRELVVFNMTDSGRGVMFADQNLFIYLNDYPLIDEAAGNIFAFGYYNEERDLFKLDLKNSQATKIFSPSDQSGELLVQAISKDKKFLLLYEHTGSPYECYTCTAEEMEDKSLGYKAVSIETGKIQLIEDYTHWEDEIK
ncbi:MAG: hypothetical protein WC480_01460 [Patescibacteria group bacterium]